MLPIHLITLEETPERERQARQELSKYPFEVQVHRFKRQSPGWKGCIDSHLQIFQHGEDTDAEMLWIAEDNLLAAHDSFPTEKYENLTRFMEKCPNWGIIFVGGYILRPWDYCQETIYPQVYETRNNNHGTISYIIHKRLYKEILALHRFSPINIHYDIFLTQQSKCYIYNPLLFYHAHNVVSNVNRSSDVWRKWWFHPKVMKFHELIFFHREWFYILLTLLVMILGGLWCRRKSLSKSASSSPGNIVE